MAKYFLTCHSPRTTSRLTIRASSAENPSGIGLISAITSAQRNASNIESLSRSKNPLKCLLSITSFWLTITTRALENQFIGFNNLFRYYFLFVILTLITTKNIKNVAKYFQPPTLQPTVNPCHYCDKVYRNRFDLNRHMASKECFKQRKFEPF